jgi:hypothetical protein
VPNSAAANIIQILANLPDFLRKPMLQSRLKEFFAMSEDDRRETIAMALESAPTIDPAKLSVLVRTWLEVISEFEPGQRLVLFSVYAHQVLVNPAALAKMDFGSLTRTFLSIGEKQRQVISDSLHEVLFATPSREKLLALIPEETQRALRLRT